MWGVPLPTPASAAISSSRTLWRGCVATRRAAVLVMSWRLRSSGRCIVVKSWCLPGPPRARYTPPVGSKLTRQYCRGAVTSINCAPSPVGALPALLVTLLLIGCNGDEGAAGKTAAEPEAVPVTVVPTRTDRVQRTVDVVGTLFGQEDTYISNKIPGRVTNIFVDVGDRVAPGQTLAQLLKNDYQLSLNEKQALLDESLAALGVDDVPGEDFEIENVPAVRRARLEAQNAKSKVERARKLHESEPPRISPQDFADLE